MNPLWRVASLSVLAAATLAACSTREVIREQPIVQREVVREQPIVQQQPVVERERVVVVQPPAAPSETIPPAPATAGYSWVAGHYEWRNGNWVWMPGQWVAGTVRPLPPLVQEERLTPPSPGARWVPGYWRFAGNDWVWVRGHWL
jgi:WXXGXW repeat (2 copies)